MSSGREQTGGESRGHRFKARSRSGRGSTPATSGPPGVSSSRRSQLTPCATWSRRIVPGRGPRLPRSRLVHPVEPPELVITKRDDEQLHRWRQRAEGAKNRLSLFDDVDAPTKPDFEVVPWRFRYRYRCARNTCTSHVQTIVDWEVVALWRRVRHGADWQDQMRQRFVDDMWSGRDSCLFVGNQEERPISFLVLGVFWPPAGNYQLDLGIR